MRKKRKRALHEPSEAPPGFGVRQSSGALALESSQPKAPEDWRTPGRYRAIRNSSSQCTASKSRRLLHEPGFVLVLVVDPMVWFEHEDEHEDEDDRIHAPNANYKTKEGAPCLNSKSCCAN